ncbi:agmatinase [Candidatus Bathyarchaeota archaeon]|nr:agmatinase [Candidatus Bathyarchaeota archaeon]
MLILSDRELYCSPQICFGGYRRAYEDSDYVVLGVPFDYTSTFRSGARFAPNHIRIASLNIETYSLRFGVDVEEVRVTDVGDLDVSGNVDETLRRTRKVVEDLVADGKIPILIGGEHTLTLGSVKAFDGKVGVVCFDAHLDLRDEYLGLRVSHATFMRRICESIGPENVLIVGVRALCREEAEFAQESGVNMISMLELENSGLKKSIEKLRRFVKSHERLYVSIDMDVLDPSIAPAVQNPEPEGLSLHELIGFMAECMVKTSALDLVEVTPVYDNGVTCIYAAKVIYEALSSLEAYRKNLETYGNRRA